METPNNWQDYLPQAWEHLTVKQRAQALCDFDKTYYTPSERISARALRCACLPWHEQPEALASDTHAILSVICKARDLARLAKQRAEIESRPIDTAPRWTPPIEALGIDPNANTNTIHGVEFEMVRKQGPRGKFWVLRSNANKQEYPGMLTGGTRPKMWDNFAWLFSKSTADDFARNFAQ